MRFIHKWIGLFLGIQLVIWMLSGFIMGWLVHDEVEGHHLQKHQEHKMDPLSVTVDIPSLLQTIPEQEVLREISNSIFRNVAVLIIRTDLATRMYNAETGVFIPVNEYLARLIAEDDFIGKGDVVKVSEILAPTMETRESIGLGWRVDFNNDENSSLYLSAETGQIWERRNDTWRFFDIFWMLHIMDYENRKDFNNWIVILSSWIVLWLTISGFIMLIENIRQGDFNLYARWRARSLKTTFTVSDADGGNAKNFEISGQQTLFNALANVDIHMPTSCGGGGSCGLCRVKMTPAPNPSASDLREIPQIELDEGYRLSCQQRDYGNVAIHLPHGLMDAEDLDMEVVEARFVTPSIREIRLRARNGKKIDFKSGDYFQVTIPPYKKSLDDINLPDELKQTWRDAGAHDEVGTEETIHRTYSAANAPHEMDGDIMFNVRLVLPAHKMASNMVGVGSAYMSTLESGACIKVRGPFGDFALKESSKEKVFIGGGAGMGPLRSMILHSLHATEAVMPVSFWYGARTLQDIYYDEIFNTLQDEYSHFRWCVALSDDDSNGAWKGETGYIHEVVLRSYLAKHPNIHSCEFYLCGPPLMLAATMKTLKKLGVSDDHIAFDDFGI